ncbi:MAG: Lrp/AsnC family transcriptional regulator [Akkermansia sp.]
MTPTIPTNSSDEINRQILRFAEDQITGFHARPFARIAELSALPEDLVITRLAAMREAGTIRRIRQTLLSTSLADGALIAWQVPEEKLEAAYAWLLANDPFTGHIVLRRSEDPLAAGARYRLWTTLKVPTGYGTVEEHCRILAHAIGALDVVPLPVVGMFALSVGHVRRAGLQVGDKLPEPAPMQVPVTPSLSQQDWDVLLSLKESLEPEEICPHPWRARAQALGMSEEQFCAIAKSLDERKVIGRFASFLDHQGRGGRDVGTRASGLFHWTVEAGQEERAGAECGRHICMTHCYWRSGGEKLAGAQIMGVVHAKSRELVMEHKAAIDEHLARVGITVKHSAIFWSERAEIRPSEIHPVIYQEWLGQ